MHPHGCNYSPSPQLWQRPVMAAVCNPQATCPVYLPTRHHQFMGIRAPLVPKGAAAVCRLRWFSRSEPHLWQPGQIWLLEVHLTVVLSSSKTKVLPDSAVRAVFQLLKRTIKYTLLTNPSIYWRQSRAIDFSLEVLMMVVGLEEWRVGKTERGR